MQITPTGAPPTPPAWEPWPAHLVQPSTMSISLNRTSRRATSTYSAAQRLSYVDIGRWEISAQFPLLDAEQTRAIRVYIAALRGQSGRVVFPVVPGIQAAAFSIDARPNVTALGLPCFAPDTSAASSQWDGVPRRTRIRLANVQGTLRAGTYLSYDSGWHRHLHMIVEDSISADGVTIVEVEPPALKMPAGAQVHIDNPSCMCVLRDGTGGALDEGIDGAAFALDLNEART